VTTEAQVTNQGTPALQVVDLKVNFRTHGGLVQAVRGVSFDLKRGETMAIVGESGSGKSVTVRTIMGILAANGVIAGGQILYDGKDLAKMREDDYHQIRGKRIGMIFQDPLSALNPIMRIGRQITEVLQYGKRMKGQEVNQRAIELMEAVGIPQAQQRFNQYPFQFSGGMRQRIVIAIALAGEPEILICDEPTTALDVTVQARILDLINQIKRERNLSVIFITHDLGVVAKMADRVCVMYAGKVVEMGTVMDIFQRPAHPYTWALLSSLPDLQTKERLLSIPGTPPNMIYPPVGDAFAARNRFAMAIDFEREPPMFQISDTHYAATWLLHPKAIKPELPEVLRARIDRMQRSGKSDV